MLFFVLGLTGCTHNNVCISYDSNYGVMYEVEQTSNNLSFSTLKVYIDPTNDDVVSRIVINQYVDSKDGLDGETVRKLKANHNTSAEFINEFHSSYIYKSYENGNYNKKGYSETIVLDLYESSVISNANDLITYIGLSEELKDGVLYYRDELLNSNNFKYSNIIEQGKMINNLSLVNDPKYTYPKNNGGK